MAVSASAITQADLIIPKPEHPMVTPAGLIDPVWHRYLTNLTTLVNGNKALANAIKTEVDTQHP